MRHEVIDLVWGLAARVGIEGRQQRRAALYPHTQIEAATLCPVLLPAQELRVAQPLLCFGDGLPTDSAQHQFMPELV